MFKRNLLLFIFIAVLAGFSVPLQAQETPPAGPAVSYFPVLPIDAASDAAPQLVPITSNYPLDGSHAGITRAIVVIHDYSRDAQGALAALSSLAGAKNATTIILAPQFMLASDLDGSINLPQILLKQFVSWPSDIWVNGGDSTATLLQKPISSFTALDIILMYLAEKSYFPDLQEIVIAGHGSGADFVQRYAVIGIAPAVLEKQNLPVRFVVANASSYLYFTGTRPKPNSLGFISPEAIICSHYNDYGYGLENLNSYARHVGANAIKTDFAEHHVTYLMGENMASVDPYPDTSCAATVQGPNRVARGLNYSRYLFQLYGAPITEKQKFYTIPKTGYDPGTLFGSSCGMSVLFGEGACPSSAQQGVLQ